MPALKMIKMSTKKPFFDGSTTNASILSKAYTMSSIVEIEDDGRPMLILRDASWNKIGVFPSVNGKFIAVAALNDKGDNTDNGVILLNSDALGLGVLVTARFTSDTNFGGLGNVPDAYINQKVVELLVDQALYRFSHSHFYRLNGESISAAYIDEDPILMMEFVEMVTGWVIEKREGPEQ